MNYYERALALKEETIAHRRFFHVNAEVGLNMPKGQAYVLEELKKLGIDAQPCGHGVTATVGKGGKCLLLRADMDALPFPENSGEPFECKNGYSHSCGHDMHAAWLMGAAKMLKENEENLEGTVKLMWQPGEETFEGAKDMIENGVLEGVDAAIAMHTATGRMPLGLVMYNNKNTMMYSNDSFKIVCVGVPSHGAYPEYGVSPINIAAHVYLGMQELIAREKASTIPAILTIGKINAGVANNSIPAECTLEGTMRTTDKELRAKLKERLVAMAENTAKAYNGSIRFEWTAEVPPAICNPKMVDEVLGYMTELNIPGFYPIPDMQASASEDFARIMEQVPSVLMYVSTGYLDRDVAKAHDPRVVYNEDALPQAAAYIAHAATRWLQNNK